MYPYFRTLRWVVFSGSRPKITNPQNSTFITSRVWLSDIDVYPELNNGRHLTIMDIGRYNHGVKMGLFKVLRENKWGLMVAGNFTRYRRRIKFLQKFTLETRIVGYDERWFYFYQETKRNGNIHSSALIRTAVTSKNGLVPSKSVSEKMKLEYQPNVPEWVTKWIELNEISPQL
jgi:acyl-CoA thioesterase FadM